MAAKFIEHRRHTMRTKPGQHLSQAGVDLARRIGNEMATFDQVLTSTIPRAFETSIAMGFAVDRQIELLSTMPEHKEVSWDAGFYPHACYIREEPQSILAQFAKTLAKFHLDLAQSLPEGGHALVISHGGFIEPSAIGCMLNLAYETWGPACNYCEGIRLKFDEGEFKECELLRVKGTILIN